MQLILARHGNTFPPGATTTWVGAKDDLPLVEEGIKQAHRLGQALSASSIKIANIYASPLKRVMGFAEIVSADLSDHPPITIDKRLTELDYGMWSGLTDAEVIERFGQEAFSAWSQKSIWPPNAGWVGDAHQVEQSLAALVKDLLPKHHQDTVLAVSSNGVLRYFLKLLPGEFERRLSDRTYKVGTGRVCILEIGDGSPKLICWNQDPFEALHLIKRTVS